MRGGASKVGSQTGGAKTGAGAPDGTEQEQPLLQEEAHRYDFFQAVRLLERRFPGTPRLGLKGPAGRERIRLRPSTSLSFPTSEVESVEWQDTGTYQDPRVNLTTNFLGLTGQGTPLPLTYAQEILWEEDDKPHMRAFVDMFHHRLLSLLYRSWLLFRHEYAFDEGGQDRLSRALLDLVGLSPESNPAALGIAPPRIMRYLGLFLMPDRPAGGLESFLSEELGVAVKVIPLTIRWLAMPADQVFKMDPSQRKRGFLGQDIVIGTRMADRCGHITLEIGPVPYERMLQFRPGEPEHRRLLALTRLFVRQPLDLELRVLFPAKGIPPVTLGGPNAAQLGRTTHMGTPPTDPMVVVYNANIADSELSKLPRLQKQKTRP